MAEEISGTPLTAEEAAALSLSSASEEEVRQALHETYARIRKAAAKGERKAALPVWKGGAYERVRAELLRQGYDVRMLREEWGGVLQDPHPYAVW